jgi:hypothetical protein
LPTQLAKLWPTYVVDSGQIPFGIPFPLDTLVNTWDLGSEVPQELKMCRSIDLDKPTSLPATKLRLRPSIFWSFFWNQPHIPLIFLFPEWLLAFHTGIKNWNFQLSGQLKPQNGIGLAQLSKLYCHCQLHIVISFVGPSQKNGVVNHHWFVPKGWFLGSGSFHAA